VIFNYHGLRFVGGNGGNGGKVGGGGNGGKGGKRGTGRIGEGITCGLLAATFTSLLLLYR
jgi:hypothetical protein